MTPPVATYRLQFRNDMTFDRASELASYVAALGVSHLYASPVFQATSDSTHGYDVTDANCIEPALGGEAGLRRLVKAMRDNGLGLIVDFVPNHMAASVENPWWRDVLKHGETSRYARHFDIDWEAGPLTLPFLGSDFDAAAKKGEFDLRREEDGFALGYYETAYPLSSETGGDIEEALQQGADLQSLTANPDFLMKLHARQPWRLADWRSGRTTLTYRRFFEITGLVGLRVEDDGVFEDVHAALFRLFDEGLIDGVRLDHIDGLADPEAYLAKLRRRLGPDAYLIVEKILEPEETLPDAWPVDGATGYEFIADAASLLTDHAGLEKLGGAYGRFINAEKRLGEEIDKAKREIFRRNLAAELDTLGALAMQAIGERGADEPAGRNSVERAIIELAVACPVYRTYVSARGASKSDRLIIARMTADAVSADNSAQAEIGTLSNILASNAFDPGSAALAFTQRFQQTTSALMAKAVEDTVYYRFNRLIALNEVGGDPAPDADEPAAWHSSMIERSHRIARARLNATATHDTKRGEDARARLYVLSEAPGEWAALAEHWRGLLSAPADDETLWVLFQALLGVWPFGEIPDADSLAALKERLCEYAVKQAREAKLHTSWTDQDSAYEERVQATVGTLFSSKAFLDHFHRAVQPFIAAGAANSLVQLLLKLTAPGAPDIYQGTEGWDLSLVDPDNRRPVDFDERRRRLGAAPELTPVFGKSALAGGALKTLVLHRALQLRRAMPDVFASGEYTPLETRGAGAGKVVAFARRKDDRLAIVAARRLCWSGARSAFELSPLEGARLILPAPQGGLTDVFTGKNFDGGATGCEALFSALPCVLLAPTTRLQGAFGERKP